MSSAPQPCVQARILSGLVAASGLAAAPVAQAQSAWGLELAPVAVVSHWREFDAQGARLLREEGVLRGGHLRVHARWAGVQWFAAGQLASGQRHYDGQDNAGIPAQTDVQVGLREWSVGGQYRWSGGWLTGLEAQSRHVKRELLDVPGGAHGYTERWRADMLWWRLGYALWLKTGRAQLSWAMAPRARTTLDLAMPGYTSARLRPELERALQLQASWLSSPGASGLPGWQWGIDSVIEQRCFDRSEAVPLRRLGRLVGVVRQPQTEELSVSVSLQLQHHW